VKNRPALRIGHLTQSLHNVGRDAESPNVLRQQASTAGDAKRQVSRAAQMSRRAVGVGAVIPRFLCGKEWAQVKKPIKRSHFIQSESKNVNAGGCSKFWHIQRFNVLRH
jgi:hypothetical protein